MAAPSPVPSAARERARRAVLDLLGLAARARAVVAGTDAVRQGAREGSLARVVLAGDAAAGQREKLVPLLEARGVPFDVVFTREDLGRAVGRNPVAAIGVSDRNLARRVGELIAALPSEQATQGEGR